MRNRLPTVPCRHAAAPVNLGRSAAPATAGDADRAATTRVVEAATVPAAIGVAVTGRELATEGVLPTLAIALAVLVAVTVATATHENSTAVPVRTSGAVLTLRRRPAPEGAHHRCQPCYGSARADTREQP